MKSILVLAVLGFVAMGCGSTGSGGAGGGSAGGGAGGGGVDPQNPPTSSAQAVESWLSSGAYKEWKCETTSHDGRSPSPHGKNRICSNAKLSGAADAGQYPVDSASVKELFNSTGTNIEGYAVYRHVAAGTTGDTWFWYERVPLSSLAPHDDAGVVANGLGGSGPAKDICVGCHQGAGSDANHSGHDFVYTQVR